MIHLSRVLETTTDRRAPVVGGFTLTRISLEEEVSFYFDSMLCNELLDNVENCKYCKYNKRLGIVGLANSF